MAALARHAGFRWIVQLAWYITHHDIQQVDTDEIVASVKNHPAHKHRTTSAAYHTTPYSTRYNAQQEIPKFKIARDGAPADAVHAMLKDELDLDGRPNLNLAR